MKSLRESVGEYETACEVYEHMAGRIRELLPLVLDYMSPDQQAIKDELVQLLDDVSLPQ